MGYLVFGLLGGLLHHGFISQLERAEVGEVVLDTDGDAAGAKHAERAWGELVASGYRVVVLSPPGYGDLNEMLVALGPEEMVEAA